MAPLLRNMDVKISDLNYFWILSSVKPLWAPLDLTSMLAPPFQVKPFAGRSDASQVVGGRGS